MCEICITKVKELNEKMNKAELQRLLQNMDVPELRRTDNGWLLRNLMFQNSNHPDFDRAMTLLMEDARQRISDDYDNGTL